MSILKDVKIWIGLLISGISLYFFTRDVVWSEVWQTVLTVSWILFIPSILINFVNIYLRAIRWRSFLGEPAEPVNRLFGLLMVCFMGNSILPARAGELIRGILLAHKSTRRFTEILATVVVERVFDFAGILICLAVVLAIAPFPVDEEGQLAFIIQTGGKASLIFVSAVAIVLLIMTYLPERSYQMVSVLVRPLPNKIWGRPFQQKILDMTVSFERGLSTFRRPSSLLWTTFLTFVVWLLLAWSEYVMVQAFGLSDTVPFLGGILIMVAICFAAAVPSAPGYVGLYQLAAKAVLVELYGVKPGVAAAFAIVLWLSQIVPIIIAGLISLNWMNIAFGEMIHAQKEASVSETS